MHSFKYLRFTTLGSKDIGIRKSEFEAKTQFLCKARFKKWQRFGQHLLHERSCKKIIIGLLKTLQDPFYNKALPSFDFLRLTNL